VIDAQDVKNKRVATNNTFLSLFMLIYYLIYSYSYGFSETVSLKGFIICLVMRLIFIGYNNLFVVFTIQCRDNKKRILMNLLSIV
jgi:hypothetical protein